MLCTGPWSIEFSVLAGTAVGLPIKYFLDKRYIFAFQTQGILKNVRVALLYVVMAVVTTMLFWFSEWLFNAIFQDTVWRLIGGAIGLVAGYMVKYQLDKKYVFIKPDVV